MCDMLINVLAKIEIWRSFCAISGLLIYPAIQTPAEFLLHLKCLLHKLQGLELLLTSVGERHVLPVSVLNNLQLHLCTTETTTAVEDIGTGIGIGTRS